MLLLANICRLFQVDDRFFWNKYMMDDLIQLNVSNCSGFIEANHCLLHCLVILGDALGSEMFCLHSSFVSFEVTDEAVRFEESTRSGEHWGGGFLGLSGLGSAVIRNKIYYVNSVATDQVRTWASHGKRLFLPKAFSDEAQVRNVCEYLDELNSNNLQSWSS